jgi:hypothetical protein
VAQSHNTIVRTQEKQVQTIFNLSLRPQATARACFWRKINVHTLAPSTDGTFATISDSKGCPVCARVSSSRSKKNQARAHRSRNGKYNFITSS